MFASESDIILEIEQYGSTYPYNPFYFNCSLISCYASENERLFISGNGYWDSCRINKIKTKETQDSKHNHIKIYKEKEKKNK